MSNIHSLKELQRAKTGPAEESRRLEEKRRSLEEKTKIFEENARVEKLGIDKKLLVQILQEENRTHDAAVKELEEKIADLEQQMKSSTIEGIPSETPSEPAQEMSEPPQEISTHVDDGPSRDTFRESAREMLQASESSHTQNEVDVPQETTKKKKRSLF